MGDFQDYTFINDFNTDISVEEEIYYLVSKILIIEKKCKINKNIILNLLNESKREQSEQQTPTTEHKIVLYNSTLSDSIQSNYIDTYQINNDIDDKNDNDTENSDRNLFLYKIYKNLARYLHPDKQVNQNNHFLDVKRAYEQENISKLIYISVINKINLNLSNSEYDILKSEINGLDNYILKLRNSVFHNWDTMSKKQKEEIINKYKDINNIM